jgi:histidyl-tRNA synthetase
MIANRLLRAGLVLVAISALAFTAVAPPERCPPVTTTELVDSSQATVDWFVRNQDEDGSWLYLYNADEDSSASEYNEVRHAGVTMGLYQAAAAGLPGALESADRGTEWALERLIERDGWAALEYGSEVNTGATALLAAGLSLRREATGDPRYDDLLRRLGVTGYSLELNSIGDRECRPAYLAALSAWLDEHDAELDDEARAKRQTSPLRVFDVKSGRVQDVLRGAPAIADALCDRCREHFESVRSLLAAYGLSYELVPTLVRGLDYYTRTTFEFKDAAIGAQDAICGGGRYDYLVEEIGGPPTPAIGFGAGLERLLLSIGEQEAEHPPIDVFFAFDGDVPRNEALTIMAELRRRGISADTEYAGRSLKGQLTQAGRLSARTTVIVDADGARVRSEGTEERVALGELLARLAR